MGRKTNIRNWPVMQEKCASCPFGENGDKMLAARVLERTIFDRIPNLPSSKAAWKERNSLMPRSPGRATNYPAQDGVHPGSN